MNLNVPCKYHTTLALLRQHDACESGYDTLVAALPEGWGYNAPIPLLFYLESNPVGDVVWALRATIEDSSADARRIACDFAQSVLHIFEGAMPGDYRPRQAIETARRFADGLATDEQLTAALAESVAAKEAAWASTWATRGAALAARSATWATSGDAWASALAAREAAWVASVTAEQEKQKEILKKYLEVV